MPKSSSTKPAGRVVRKRLADGTVKEYRYGAWQPAAAPVGTDTMRALLRAYELSPEWAALSPITQKQYLIYLRTWLDVPDADPKAITRREILATRDAIAASRGKGAAAAFGRITAILFGWALDREWIPFNPAARLRAVSGGTLPAWSEAQIHIARTMLPEPFRRVVVLALHTGQRRGDLCAMRWSAYDGKTIRLKQGKTGRQLVIPVHPDLQDELDAWRAEQPGDCTILRSPRTEAWGPEHLSREMGRMMVKIGLPKGLNVHGLRKAAARRLAEAGCSASEIASITGHLSLSMVQLYTASADQGRLAEAAMARLKGRDTTALTTPTTRRKK